MGNSESSGTQQAQTGSSPIIDAKALLSGGDEKGAWDVLNRGACNGNVMACYDAGYMLIQGIGCNRNMFYGLALIDQGMKLEAQSNELIWKSDGSVTELIDPQSMNLSCLLRIHFFF